MREYVSAVTPTQAASLPQTRAERRQMRRAGVSLQVRIRSADFNDGNFDEVRVTQNASRKAIYFFTKLDRYYRGMRVRVTSPYEPEACAANLEQVGEVARVHRREDGYGVAIALLSRTQPAGTQPDAPKSVASAASVQGTGVATTAPSERRCATRSPFIAPVEMVEMRTELRHEMRELGTRLLASLEPRFSGLESRIARVETRMDSMVTQRQLYGAILGQMAILLGIAYFFLGHVSR